MQGVVQGSGFGVRGLRFSFCLGRVDPNGPQSERKSLNGSVGQMQGHRPDDRLGGLGLRAWDSEPARVRVYGVADDICPCLGLQCSRLVVLCSGVWVQTLGSRIQSSGVSVRGPGF